MKKIIALLFLVISFNGHAQGLWTGFVTYSPWDLWLPGKYGVMASYKPEPFRDYELAWQKGSYGLDLFVDDIGGISEQRIHFTTRSFAYENSFNYQYGISYNAYRVNLGNGFVGVDLLELKTFSAVWGVGNRWNLDHNITIGADWIKIFLPIYTLDKDDDAVDSAETNKDRNDLKDLIYAFSKIPTFTVLHFEIGYRF